VIKSKSMCRAVYVGKGIQILVGKDCSRDHRYDLDVVQTQYESESDKETWQEGQTGFM